MYRTILPGIVKKENIISDYEYELELTKKWAWG
jgi:hypothetical protein